MGYHIEIIPYRAADLLQRAMDVSNSIVDPALAKKWMSLISTQYSHEEYWYSNETNLLRMSILYVTGGIYLDTDVVLVRPLVPVEPFNDAEMKTRAIMKNTVTDHDGLYVDNVMARDNEKFECAVMKFLQPGNEFLGHAMNNFLRHYNGTVWGNNGPNVFGRVSDEMPHLLCAEPYDFTASKNTSSNTEPDNHTNTCSMQPLPGTAFQPVPWWEWKNFCYDINQSPVGPEASTIISKPNVYAVHMNNHMFGNELEKNSFVPGSVCDITLKNFCIICE
jgi:alpha 1,4-N-acetylglucosaminyltransferase